MNDIAVLQPSTPGVLDVINNAVANNASVEVLERLYALYERQQAAEAKRQFDEAMANFQAECPIIVKSQPGAKTRSGAVAYHYAPLDRIVSAVRELLNKYGLSYSFDTENEEGTIRVICTVKHVGGHSERSTVQFRLGTKTDVMSCTQQDAATVTYNKRYAFCNAFGIMTGDTDTDCADDLGGIDAVRFTEVPTDGGRSNTNSPNYQPPAKRNAAYKASELEAAGFRAELEPPIPVAQLGTPKIIDWANSKYRAMIDRAMLGCKREFYLTGKGVESPRQIIWDAALITGKDELAIRLIYGSPQNARERSKHANPAEYVGKITARVDKEGSEPGTFWVTDLNFEEVSNGNANHAS